MTSRNTQVTRKCRQTNDGDLISNLPESVICHILSRLPSKDVVRTSVLSKDWEYKWTCVYNVDIDDLGSGRKKEVFVEYVDRVLLLSHNIKSFRLYCDNKYQPSRLRLWICTALRRNIENFELRLRLQKGFVLPRILNNNFLRKMKLDSSCTFRDSSCTFRVTLNNHFPNLTDLYLERVEILNELSNSDPLVFTFPLLKTFELVECKWSNVNAVEIYSPTLGIFKCKTDWKGEITCYSIKICGARLEEFQCSGGYPENFILYESVVLDAYLGNYPQNYRDFQSGLQIRKLLKAFSSVTSLWLSTYICKAIAKSKQELALPQYDMLQRLHINVIDNAELILEVLHSAPSLKFLHIDQDRHKFPQEYDCDEVDHVPYCVISLLEEVNFERIQEKPLFHLAMFFLKNGVKLKKVCLINYYSRKVGLVEELSKFPKATACVEIVTR